MVDVAAEATKRCPFCGEQILAVAIKCKHCSSALVEQPAQSKQPKTEGDALGILLALVPWAGLLLCWVWVGESPLITASSNLTTLTIVVLLATAILMAMDASALRMGRKDGPMPTAFGPVGAFIGSLFLWIIVYPAHMSHRAKAGAPGRLAPALLGAILFAVSAGYLAYVIDERMSEIRRAFGG